VEPHVDGAAAGDARPLGLDPAAFLEDNDSMGFFARIGDPAVPGPTWNKVDDVGAILVDTR